MSFGVDDYYLRANSPTNPVNDRWGYASHNCTSFAMQRWVQDLGQRAGYWGNARDWPSRARADGRRVDATPALHALMVLQPGVDGAFGAGHVAVILGVGAGFNNVEDYDWTYLAWKKHALATGGGISYIHPAAAPTPPPPTPVPTPAPASGIHYENFSVQARPSWPAAGGQTLHVRSGPGTNFGVIGNVAEGAWLHCDAWARGTVIWDPRGRNNDSRWYRLHGWGWVASALCNGDAPNSTAR